MYFFSKDGLTRLYRRVCDILSDQLNGTADHKAIRISSKRFMQAIAEADLDIHFMEVRRNLNDSTSEGKLAGALYYRLTRAKIILLPPGLFDDDRYRDIQERVMMQLVTELLNAPLDHPWIRNLAGTKRDKGLRSEFQNISGELIYLTSKRHYTL